jgi:hypothetical protein
MGSSDLNLRYNYPCNYTSQVPVGGLVVEKRLKTLGAWQSK